MVKQGRDSSSRTNGEGQTFEVGALSSRDKQNDKKASDEYPKIDRKLIFFLGQESCNARNGGDDAKFNNSVCDASWRE